MEKRILGRTGYEVSVIGFGGIPIQNVDKDTAIKLVEEAHKQGINFIDTARSYNDSEKLLGQALEVVGREKFYIATKSMQRTYDGVLKDLEISLKNLKVDSLDLYQFHNVSKESEMETIFSENGALKAVKEMKEKGIIKEIGVTSHSVDLLNKLIDTNEFSTIQFPYNIVENQAEEAFKKAKEKNIGILIMKPLAGGAIPKGELCLRYIMENENITLAIPGMDTIEQVKENAGVGNNPRPLAEEEIKELQNYVEELGTQFCRRCGYCAPCSVGIDIPTNFLMEGYYTRYDLKDWALSRYNGMEVNAKDCIECGDCEPRCPYDLPIIEMLKNVAKVLG
ncbi:aldo/keto reductase [Miniphocaeibacter halophilus]|uniref:Aldo/keto reductase n=1 Tax=Miniphocaeibacter halophilus TaxID=2931922 RepID=A0AC61MRN1_9FIRM|nr:aldo/keto reductase [Miniphocaeibacter halophilus]QQK08315.1 aldo/keto reductase [Miniphocaeibacter halophilus]